MDAGQHVTTGWAGRIAILQPLFCEISITDYHGHHHHWYPGRMAVAQHSG